MLGNPRGEKELLRNPDHESQRIVLVAGRNLPTSKGRKIDPCPDEGLVWPNPSVARLIGEKRRSRRVQPFPCHGKPRLWFANHNLVGKMRRVVGQCFPGSANRKSRPKPVASKPELACWRFRRIGRWRNKKAGQIRLCNRTG